MMLSVHVLQADPVQRFVSDVRTREGIVPPIVHEDLQANLRDHPPEQFEEQALPVAREVLEEEMEDLPEVREGFRRLEEQLEESAIDATGDATSLLGTFDEVLQLDQLSQQGARIIARHIVVGLMEPALPLSIDTMGVVYVVDTDDTGPMVVGIATQATDLDALLENFRTTCRHHFVPGKRHRVPRTFIETAWLRFCRTQLKRHGHEEGRMDMQLAELSYEIWPETRPGHDIASPEYEAELRKKADQIRANSKNFEHWRDKYFPD